MLKRLPGATKENDGENDKSIINESCLKLLKENCMWCWSQEAKAEKRSKSHYRKKSNISWIYTGNILNFLKEKKRKAVSYSAASCSYSISAEEKSESEEAYVVNVMLCGKRTTRGGLCRINLILLFIYNVQGVFFGESFYYEVDIETLNFCVIFAINIQIRFKKNKIKDIKNFIFISISWMSEY